MKITLSKLLAVIAAVAVLPVVSGCEKETGENGKDSESVLTFESAYVEVVSAGGDMLMKYTIENPTEGAVPTAAADAEWISSCTVGDEAVSFTVGKNESEESRTANVNVNYDGKTYSFEVRQAGAGEVGTEDPDIQLSAETVDAAAAGGEYYVEYTVTNAQSGMTVGVNAQEDWIGPFDTSVDGRISFTVQENTGAARSSEVTVTYAGVERVFTVNQEAGVAEEEETISIEIVDASTLNVVVSVIPSDKEMRYMASAATKEFIDSFSSDEALFEDEMTYYTAQAEGYGVDLATYLQFVVLFQGDNPSMPMSAQSYDEPYYAYAYGVDEVNVRLITKVYKVEFTVPSN